MYAMSEDRARPPGPGRAEHELPVLFHLMDVSRPRQSPPEVSPLEAQCCPTTEPQISTPTASQHLSSIASELLPLPAAPTVTGESELLPPISVAASFEPLPATHHYPVSDTLLAAVTSEIAASEPATSEIPQPSASLKAVDLAAQATEPSEAQPSETPKNQLAPRRKLKTPASEDWFAAHGKYIALGFVLALIGTIWMSRTNRQRANPPAASADWKPLIADDRASGPLSAPTITIPAAGSAHSTVLVSAGSQVELHPPTTTAIAKGSSGEGKNQGQDKLFDFPSAKRADDRVAARPDSGTINASSSSQKYTSATATEGPAVTPAPSSAPALSLAYPTTAPAGPTPNYPAAVSRTSSYPQTSAPVLVGPNPPTGAGASPAANYSGTPQYNGGAAETYRSQFPVPAGAAAPQSSAWGASPSGGNLPGPYQSLDNTARGPRNERTGSGNY